MEASQIIAGPNGIREALDDTKKPYLYSDAGLLASMNSGYVEVALRTRCLQDDVGPACLIPIVAGQTRYPVAVEVIVVRAAHIAGIREPLTLCTTGVLDQLEPGWSHMPRETTRTRYAVFDGAQKTITLYPAPTEDGTLLLRVWRVPDDSEVLETIDDDPIIELPDPLSIKHWVLHECYMQKDTEQYDPERAQQHMAIFEEQFGPRPSMLALGLWSTSPACRRTRIQDF